MSDDVIPKQLRELRKLGYAHLENMQQNNVTNNNIRRLPKMTVEQYLIFRELLDGYRMQMKPDELESFIRKSITLNKQVRPVKTSYGKLAWILGGGAATVGLGALALSRRKQKAKPTRRTR